MHITPRRIMTTLACSAALLGVAGAVPAARGFVGQQEQGAASKLIKQLGDESFDVRRNARNDLFKMGQSAIPALLAAALDKSNETGYSAVRILARMMKELQGDDAAAAKEALSKLAKGEDAIARQARESLEEAGRQPQRRVNGMRPGGGVFQFGGNGRNRSSQTTIVNGVQNTTVREPGVTVEISRDPNGSVSVTQTLEGKKPKTWKAKSLDELKKNHPEGFKVFEEYGRTAVVRVPDLEGLLAMPPMMDPFQGMDPFERFDRLDPFRRRRPAPKVDKEVKDAQLLIQDMSDLLRSLKRKSNAPELQRMESKLDALKRNLDRIQKAAQ